MRTGRTPDRLTSRSNRRKVLLAIAGAAAGTAFARSATVQRAAHTAADDYFLDCMAREHIPGLAVAVLRGRSLVWSKGYGWANLAQRVPMTPDTIQNIGSVSKTFTATAVMQLFDAGRFELDDDVNRYLGFRVEHPMHPAAPITIRQLLSHTSSIADGPAYDRAYACGDPSQSLEEWLRGYLATDGRDYDGGQHFHTWAPGKEFAYSNVAFGLLGHLVERLSGVPFADYCRQRIFQPLGMSETSWYLRDIDPARHSIPYSWVSAGQVRGPSWGGQPPRVIGDPEAAARVDGGYAASCLYNHPNFPDGFLRSSVHQLARYAGAYLEAARPGNSKLLRPETIARMFRPESGDDARVMGLCWNAQRRTSTDLLWGHMGSDPGINANLRLRFADGVAAIVLMNTNIGRPRGFHAPLEFGQYLVEHSAEL